ncbi:squalene monooxygenase Erg1 [Lophiotrema nucula]|uniref:Squalene monooxygenase n=1 Tax=Lophiotrema nucula TaxID=690887 RepID=A0A6A5YGG8_9PLEO|nr:squalene monooxygenase Erg1 [Lophiotrema nucula]
MSKIFDFIVVGAGVAGSAVAVTLARQRYEVLLLERSLERPDRIVGELLQPGGVIALKKLDLDLVLEDIDAIPVLGYHVSWKGEETTFPYPSPHQVDGSANNIFTERPTLEGRSFHHGNFISALRKLAKQEEKVTVVESNVTDFVTDNEAGQVLGIKCPMNKEYLAKFTILADGSKSNLRSKLHDVRPQVISKFWGLEMVASELQYQGFAHGILGNGPLVLMYQIGSHEARILMDAPCSIHASDAPEYFKRNVAPRLPECIRANFISAMKKDRLRSQTNEYLPSQATSVPGVLAIGDANSIRHPLTGGGMTVALNDVLLLRDLLSPEAVCLDEAHAVAKQLRSFHRERKKYSITLSILAQALYALFVTTDPHLEPMQRGFMLYIQRGGQSSEGPCALMGGIYQQPMLLFYHFFAIAIYSMWRLMLASPAWMFPATLAKCAIMFCKAVGIILPVLMSELFC